MLFKKLSLKTKGLFIVLMGVTAISFDALLVRLANTGYNNIIFWRGIFIFISLALILFSLNRALIGKGLDKIRLPVVVSSFKLFQKN